MIYKSKEEMIKKLEDEKQEAIRDINESFNKELKEKKKKLLKIIIIVTSVFILFKLLIGVINLNIPVEYNHRLYDVTINNKLISVCVDEYRKNPIIPFMIYNNYVGLHCYHRGGLRQDHKFNIGDKIKINIDTYECFNQLNNKSQTSCYPFENQEVKKTDDTNYSLSIKRAGGAEKTLYEGDLIFDISDYFVEKGVYSISIIANYDNVKSFVSFGIRI